VICRTLFIWPVIVYGTAISFFGVHPRDYLEPFLWALAVSAVGEGIYIWMAITRERR
jgi:hypothetical protein